MDKFKKEMQDKFHKREIQPTDEVWGKITGELATSRTSKTKSFWLWSGIAAGFIGFLVLLTPLYFSTSTIQSVVNSEEKETQEAYVQLEKAVGVNQLKSNGIQPLTVEILNSSLPMNNAQPKRILPQGTSQNFATTLLAEVEKELEVERYTQQNINEVDALLAQARSKISSEKDLRVFDQLSAESLLAEIDFENTNNLKNKVWKLIEANYKELKSSLSAR